MSIYKDIYVSKKEPLVVEIAEGTNGIDIELHVADWTIPTSATAQIYLEKPSGALIYNAASIEDNSIIISPTTQMTAEVGVNKGQLRIVNGTDILHTFIFYVKVYESIIDDSAIESQDEFTALEEALSAVSDMVSHSELQGKGSATQPIYFDANGEAQITTYPLLMNALNQAGLVAAPTASNANSGWGTDGSGVPSWNDNFMKIKTVTFTDSKAATKIGMWAFTASEAANIANLPVTDAGFLMTLNSSTTTNAQLFIRAAYNEIYERFLSGGSWSAWRLIYSAFTAFTCSVGTTQFEINRQRCFRSGDRVVISFDATANDDVSTGTGVLFLQIPDELAPSENQNNIGWVSNSTNIYCALAKIFKSGSHYYAGQNAFGTIASGTRLSVYCEYYI